MNYDTLSYLQHYTDSTDFRSLIETCKTYHALAPLFNVMTMPMNHCIINIERYRKTCDHCHKTIHKLTMRCLRHELDVKICNVFITHLKLGIRDAYQSTYHMNGHLPHLSVFEITIWSNIQTHIQWSEENNFTLFNEYREFNSNYLNITLPMCTKTLKYSVIYISHHLNLNDNCKLKTLITSHCKAHQCENIQTLKYLDIANLQGKFSKFPPLLNTLKVNQTNNGNGDFTELKYLPSSLITLSCPMSCTNKVLEPLPSSLKFLRIGKYKSDYHLPDGLERLELFCQSRTYHFPSQLKYFYVFESKIPLIIPDQVQYLGLGNYQNIIIPDRVWCQLKSFTEFDVRGIMCKSGNFFHGNYATYVPQTIECLSLPYNLNITSTLPCLEYLHITSSHNISHDRVSKFAPKLKKIILS